MPKSNRRGRSVAVPVGSQHELLGQAFEVRQFPLLVDVTDFLKCRDAEPGGGEGAENGRRPSS